nr:tRNA modification GTPase mnme [Tanacetum cinerariifolium]
MIVGEVNTRVTELAELHEHDTQDLYALLEDAYDSRTRISQRVTVDSQRVDLLMDDRIAHQETIQIVEDEAYVIREAWAHSIGLSQAVNYELQTHQEQGDLSSLVKSLRVQCIEFFTEIEAWLDFDDEMSPLEMDLILSKISATTHDVESAMETANYDKFLKSRLQESLVVFSLKKWKFQVN